jgi:multidrug transporter EmrE-like cation transporter
MTIALLVIAMIFNLLAQSILKYAVSEIHFDQFTMSTISRFVFSPLIWLGAVIYGASFFFYIFALSRGELSRISPVSQALTTIGILLISVLVFQEPLTVAKIIGLVFLIIGTIVIFV